MSPTGGPSASPTFAPTHDSSYINSELFVSFALNLANSDASTNLILKKNATLSEHVCTAYRNVSNRVFECPNSIRVFLVFLETATFEMGSNRRRLADTVTGSRLVFSVYQTTDDDSTSLLLGFTELTGFLKQLSTRFGSELNQDGSPVYLEMDRKSSLSASYSELWAILNKLHRSRLTTPRRTVLYMQISNNVVPRPGT